MLTINRFISVPFARKKRVLRTHDFGFKKSAQVGPVLEIREQKYLCETLNVEIAAEESRLEVDTLNA